MTIQARCTVGEVSHPGPSRRRNRSEDSADAVLTSLEAALIQIQMTNRSSLFPRGEMLTLAQRVTGAGVRVRIADVASPVASAFSTVPASNGALEAAHRHVTVDSVPGTVVGFDVGAEQ